MPAVFAEILKLSLIERLQLVEAIWDSIAAEAEKQGLTDSQREELERRWADDEANPNDVVPWETVLADARVRANR